MDEKKLGLALTEDIVYVCDREACENCSTECNHTSDIHHAKNFTEVAPGKFMENYTIPKLEISWKKED